MATKKRKSAALSPKTIRQALVTGDAGSMPRRIQRYRRLSQLFPISGGMLILGGQPAWLALEEMWRSYIGLNDLAVVLCAQTFVEHSLAVHHIMSGDDATAEGGFAKLIEAALRDGDLSPMMAERMHHLRRLRNPYVHPRGGLRPGTYIHRLVESGHKDPLDLLQADAEFALQIVADFIRPDAAVSE